MIHRALLSLIPDALAAPARWGRPFTIDEPDVTFTDFGLALETGVFAVVLARQSTQWPRLRWWSVAFCGTAALASLAGATDHGFFRRDGREVGHDLLWTTTLLAIGATALTLVAIGAEIGLGRPADRRLTVAAVVAAAAYAVVVLVAWREFLIAILAYAPAALFLLGILLRRYVRQRDRGSSLGIVAVLLAVVAAAVQHLKVGVHPRYLGHNAVYHLIQAVSFALFFAAARDLLTVPERGGVQ